MLVRGLLMSFFPFFRRRAKAEIDAAQVEQDRAIQAFHTALERQQSTTDKVVNDTLIRVAERRHE